MSKREYTAGITTMWFTCTASSVEEAERKYELFFDNEDGSCCAPEECTCELNDCDTTHDWV